MVKMKEGHIEKTKVKKHIFRSVLPLVTAGMIALSTAASRAEEVKNKEAKVDYDNFTVGGQSFNSMRFESPIPISDKVSLIVGVEKSQKSTTVVGTEQVTNEEVSYPSNPISRVEVVPETKVYLENIVTVFGGDIQIDVSSINISTMYPTMTNAVLNITNDSVINTVAMSIGGVYNFNRNGQNLEIAVGEICGGDTPLDSYIKLKVIAVCGPERKTLIPYDNIVVDSYKVKLEGIFSGGLCPTTSTRFTTFTLDICDLDGNKILEVPMTTTNGHGSITVDLPNGDKMVIDAAENGIPKINITTAVLRKNTTVTTTNVEKTYSLGTDDTNILVGIGGVWGPVGVKLLVGMLDRLESVDSKITRSSKMLPRVVIEGGNDSLQIEAVVDQESKRFGMNGLLETGTGMELKYENTKNIGEMIWEVERTAAKLKQKVAGLLEGRVELGIDTSYELDNAKVSGAAGSRQDSSESAGYGLYGKYNDKEKQLCIEGGVSKQVSLPQQNTNGFMAFVKAKYRSTSIEASTKRLGSENDTRAKVVWSKKF